MFSRSQEFLLRTVQFCMPASFTLSLWPHLPAPGPGENRVEIHLDIDGKRQLKSAFNITHPEIEVFLPDPEINTGAAIVACPGGGFRKLEIEKEGYHLADWCNAHGVAAIVVKYRLPSDEPSGGAVPLPLQDARRAMRLVRAHAEEWQIDSKRIGIAGFSSGGYLAAIQATLATAGDPDSPDPIERHCSRPDFAILVYSAISNGPLLGKETRTAKFLGPGASAVLRDAYSPDLHVTDRTPPTFMIMAADDPKVTPENGHAFRDLLVLRGIPCQLHILSTGSHGFGMGIRGGEPTHWPALLLGWLQREKIVSSHQSPTQNV